MAHWSLKPRQKLTFENQADACLYPLKVLVIVKDWLPKILRKASHDNPLRKRYHTRTYTAVRFNLDFLAPSRVPCAVYDDLWMSTI